MEYIICSIITEIETLELYSSIRIVLLFMNLEYYTSYLIKYLMKNIRASYVCKDMKRNLN